MKKFFKLLPILALVGFASVSCSKHKAPSCTNYNSQVTINNDNSYTVMVAQMMASSPIMFQIGAVDQDCEDQYIFQMTVDSYGTHTISEWSNTVSVIKANLTTMSQTMYILSSGTVSITDHGNDSYTFEVNGQDDNGNSFTFNTTHSF